MQTKRVTVSAVIS